VHSEALFVCAFRPLQLQLLGSKAAAQTNDKIFNSAGEKQG
jgi:hypothetical protein